MHDADRYLVVVALACCGGGTTPAITNTTEAKPASVILLATDGLAAPIACTGAPKLDGGEACASRLPARPQLRSASGANVTTFGWDADRHVCPWQPEPEVTRGLLRLCAGDDCTMPEELMVWPPSSSTGFAKLAPIAATDPQLAREVAVVAKHEMGPLFVQEAFAAGDDRIVVVHRPTADRRHELGDPAWTVVTARGESHVLADASCGRSGQVVGVIDLDGERLVVMRFQYQIVLYRLDGSIRLEGPACCGLG